MSEKEKRVVFRISEDNYQILAEAAQNTGLTISAYVRSIALAQAREENEKVTRDLGPLAAQLEKE